MYDQEKNDFVGNQLKYLLTAANVNVTDCRYIIKDNTEYVRITYQNHYYKDICIDGDSLVAIVYDVVRKFI